MKILYCIAGMGCYGVLESDILNREEFYISAKRVFSIEVNSSQTISSPRGRGMQSFVISIFENVTMNCNFIANMSEEAPFYKEIMKIVESGKVKEVNA
jgi:hypothetical protein